MILNKTSERGNSSNKRNNSAIYFRYKGFRIVLCGFFFDELSVVYILAETPVNALRYIMLNQLSLEQNFICTFN